MSSRHDKDVAEMIAQSRRESAFSEVDPAEKHFGDTIHSNFVNKLATRPI
jgi:hypothetical protein